MIANACHLNWYVGWSMILAAFVSGAIIGLYFHREDFLGGYASFQRRILRLGHIALAALGMMNVLFSLMAMPSHANDQAWVAHWALAFGGISMPTVCFLSAWRKEFRHLFFIPVTSLVIAATQILRIGPP